MHKLDKTLDPCDWAAFRQSAHEMLDDMLEYLENIRARRVWQPIPSEVREKFHTAAPRGPTSLADVHGAFLRDILPHGSGNLHPGFMGWVQGGGTPVGMLAEMLSAGMNSNLGGRDHVPAEVERQVTAWMCELFGFPDGSSGLFVTGTSMANLNAVAVARNVALRSTTTKKLTAYASSAVHGCIAKALDVCGLRTDSLRLIRTDCYHRIDTCELERVIEADRRAGFTPFLIVGTAGTVDIGAIDDLDALATTALAHKVWFHVDGAYAALAILAPELAPRLKGIERADSLAFDFHKWGQVPYPAGFLLMRHGWLQREAFACSAPYLNREGRGLAAGHAWPCDFGIDLSRGFQALKVWFSLKVYGTDAIGAQILETCALAAYLERRISLSSELELLAPVQLNIVCFRFRAQQSDAVNAEIVVRLQESGEVAPSTTLLDGRLAIRAAIVNHRTTQYELDVLVERTLEIGRSLQARSTGPSENTDWIPRTLKESALSELEQRLESTPQAIDLLVERAALLSDLGRLTEAREQYLTVLALHPTHLVALGKLGTLLYGTGYRTAARTAYAEAVAHHPTDVKSLVNLANVLLDEGNAIGARQQYALALTLDSNCPDAHQGMARALAELGDNEVAEAHRRLGYRNNSVATLPYRGSRPPVNLLLLVSALGGNVPLRHILDDCIFRTTAVTAEYFDHQRTLPPHHVIFNSIGDADLSSRALIASQSLIACSVAPVINSPAAVFRTGRADTTQRLRDVSGVITPRTVILPRASLLGDAGTHTLTLHGFEFPLLLRAPGFHTGLHFVKVDRAADLPHNLSLLPGPQVMVIEYLDARDADGKFRKYRVMMIDGKLYPLHLAISTDWKIHYFTAEMADNSDHRAEDDAFLKDMPRALGKQAMEALVQIQRVLGLDYAGIDFGLNPRGEVLLFEANATMVVLPPGREEQWGYRTAPVKSIYSAVRKMLLDRAGQTASQVH